MGTGATKTIRLELEVEVDDDWPGDNEACDAALSHVPNGVIDLGSNRALLILSVSAEVVGDESST